MVEPACLRAGQFVRAVAALEESLLIDANWDPVLVHSALTMARHRLEDKFASFRTLVTAQAFSEGNLLDVVADPQSPR